MSNPIITSERVRILIDKNNPFTALNNVLTSGAIDLVNSEGVQFEFLVYDSSAGVLSDTTTVNSWTNINSVVIALQDTPNPHNATVFWSASLAQAAIHQTCTVANWNAGTDQHGLLVVPGTQAYFNITQPNQGSWLCIYALSTDATPNVYLLAAFQITVSDSGIPSGLGTFYLLGPDNLVHAVYITKDGTGNMVLAVEQTGIAGNGLSAPFLASPDGVYRRPTLVQVGGIFLITLT